MIRITFYTILLLILSPAAYSQDSNFVAKHRAIFFPYPMYKEKWRTSLGFSFLTTPEDITEEIRLRIPCGEFTVLRKISEKVA